MIAGLSVTFGLTVNCAVAIDILQPIEKFLLPVGPLHVFTNLICRTKLILQYHAESADKDSAASWVYPGILAPTL